MIKYIFSTFLFAISSLTLFSQTANLSGTFTTEAQTPIPGVVVQLLDNQGQLLETAITDGNGAYFFADLPTGETYTIEAEKDDNAQTDVSTFDMVLAARHLLGMELLDSPYKVLAADVDRSGYVSTFDLIRMRSVILASSVGFPDSIEWIFVAADYEFPNPNNPFPFTPDNSFELNGNISDAHFIGVKLGSIN
jgi:hypothetical protein